MADRRCLPAAGPVAVDLLDFLGEEASREGAEGWLEDSRLWTEGTEGEEAEESGGEGSEEAGTGRLRETVEQEEGGIATSLRPEPEEGGDALQSIVSYVDALLRPSSDRLCRVKCRKEDITKKRRRETKRSQRFRRSMTTRAARRDGA